MKKSVVIGVCILCILLIVAGVWLFVVFGVPALSIGPFKKQIMARSYKDAESIYEEFSAEDRTRANAWMREYIEDTEKSYYEGKLDSDSALEIIEELMQYKAVYDTAYQSGEAIVMDTQATASYERAKEYGEENRWDAAYLELEDIHVRYRLYDEVASFRDECATKYRTEILKQMEQCAEGRDVGQLQQLRDSALRILPQDKQIVDASQTHLDNYVDAILADAEKMAKEKEYSAAVELLEYAHGAYANKSFLVARAKYEYAAIEAYCETLISSKDYLGAVKYAQEQSGAYPQCAELVAEYGKLLVEDTLETADGYSESGQYEKAIEAIESVIAVYNHSNLTQALSEIRYEAVQTRCEAFMAQGDLLGAVKYAKEHSGNDSKCVALLEKYAELLIEDTLSRATDYAQMRDFQKAIDLIEEARLVYDNAELVEAAEVYAEYLPISLADCLSDRGNQLEYGDLVDAYGKTHKNAVGFQDSLFYATYNTYYLAEKYVSFEGSVCIDSPEAKFMVSIFLDGELAYESEEITLTSGEVFINLDLSDVNDMRIDVSGIDNRYTLIFDVVLS